ncbi:MAG: DUF4294 domain-containing protein [Flavobacteriales bacterium]|nr:DUF4294 domain-containing protein [Flavobacteriales bacterium]
MFRKALPTLAILALCAALPAKAQTPAYVVHAVVEGTDTIPLIYLGEARVEGRWKPRDRREAERYDKLMRNVIKVYPYARITGQLLSEYESELKAIEGKSDQELYVKIAEAELRAEFEAEVKDLTVSQGRVLVKLIDRETGHTSYELVKQLRGSFVAFVWQGLARLFDQDLKSEYDREGADATIELIVQRIERGELAVADRSARTAKAQAKLEKRKARLYRKYGLSADHLPQ